ncbi:glycogen/starch/alpha-glucan phosphorylase [Finegoldia magna]|uniref:glycogen/starch/alpha-glucan phosphorylase n=1 Tax=Finegoldia magna TaxID=1260 RepID=UPI000763C0BC|nr:glycogen/starch/alpha-glucan phosphorylase [Finegoldia magna]KXA10512.1 phosphorylase, glycogen/starch/alpha-glucan family [Finegoldia magna]
MEKEEFLLRFEKILFNMFGKDLHTSTKKEKYIAFSKIIMNELADDWKKTSEKHKHIRNAYYFSAEFLIGRSLGNNLLNMGLDEKYSQILKELDIDINDLEIQEEDAALGNGGLGRLAACFMESAASLDYPLTGYGVRYRQGLFKQYFHNGFQMEVGDNWTLDKDPWSRRVESESKIIRYKNQVVKAVPYDMPVIGYKNHVVNTLRLWQAECDDGFDFQKFNNFQYDDSVKEKNRAEDITRVLYPNDIQRPGKVLRLKQQYFFSSASIQDIIEKYEKNFPNDVNFEDFAKYNTIQLNDTHPVMAIPEMMRVLMDDKKLSWKQAWKVTSNVFNYTNHTILQEAMEKWNVDVVEEVSPRIMDIITEIDRRFVSDLVGLYYSVDRIDNLRIVKDNTVNMAHLAILTAVKINGVAKIHTEILKNDTLKPWHDLYPDKFVNKTNGITPRRWLFYANPELTQYITELLGEDWKTDLTKLKELEKFRDEDNVLDRLMEIKLHNKIRLKKYIKEHEQIDVDENSIFDIQVKRLHEYKRQLLNAFHILNLYYKIKNNEITDIPKQTYIFGAKAAPGYFRAKAIIKFINEVKNLVNNDDVVNKYIKVVFLENFNVSIGELVYPAADVSEQISTAGKEASGTGNMKFMLNGALTVGTYDGANIEIFNHAGEDNNFPFGATVDVLNSIRDSYNPVEYYYKDENIKRVVDTLLSDLINDSGSFMFLDIYNSLVNRDSSFKLDEYYVLKDFNDYEQIHEKILQTYADKKKWAKMSLMNIANFGEFSSDRTIKEYAEEIWRIVPNEKI